MELGVFELGLKNQQLSTIRCFLKIQTEALRILRSPSSTIEADGRSLLQWVDIYSKIARVVTSSLRDRTSPSIQVFGHDLAVISLTIASDIIEIFCDETINFQEDDEEGKEYHLQLEAFLQKFFDSLTIIRESCFACDRRAVDGKTIDSENKKWAQYSREDSATLLVNERREQDKDKKKSSLSRTDFVRPFILQHVIGDKESLLDVQLNLLQDEEVAESSTPKHDEDSLLSWKEITELFLEEALRRMMGKEWERVGFILSLVNYSLQDFIPFFMRVSFDQELRREILLRYSMSSCHIDKWSILEERLAKINQIYDSAILQVNLESIESLSDDFFKFLLPGFLERNQLPNSLSEKTLLFQSLLQLNETDKLIEWIRCSSTDELSKIMSLPLTSHLLTNEKVYSTLVTSSHYDLFLDLSQLSKYAYRNGIDILSNTNFLQRFLSFCWNHELHEFVLWLPTFSNQTTPSSFQLYELPPKGSYTSLVEKMAQIVYRPNIDDQNQSSIFNIPDLPLEILTATLFGCDDFGKLDLQMIYRKIKSRYPMIAKSIITTGLIDTNENTQTASCVYMLLDKTTPLKVDQLFLWQDKNQVKQRIQEMPSFSQHHIPNFRGIQTNIDTIYFIREGRPCHSFIYGNKEDSLSTDTIMSVVCSSGTRRVDTMCSSVLFLEMTSQNSWKLRVHLEVGNFIAKYAPDFLGFKPRQQELELSRLLREAVCHKKGGKVDNPDVIKTLSILLAAFERRFSERCRVTVDEIIEWQKVYNFCSEHAIPSATDLLTKCAQNDDWLSFVVCSQLYDYPKDTVISLLPNFNNGCIADHLEKAFRSSSTNSDKDDSPTAIMKTKIVKKDSMQSRHSLYNKIGVRKSISAIRQISGKSNQSTSSLDDDSRSVMSEADTMTFTDSGSVLSIGSGETTSSDGEWSQVEPKDFYHLIILAQKKSPIERSLLSLGLSLRNHVVVLLSASIDGVIQPSFDVMCWWLVCAFKLTTFTFNENLPWTLNKFINLLRDGLRTKTNLRILKMGLELFRYDQNPVYLLVNFFVEYILEKKLTQSIDTLKNFQDCFWKFSTDIPSIPLQNIHGLSHVCGSIITSSLQLIETFYDCRLLLRHFDFARVHSMFPIDIKITNFNQLNRMCQAVVEIPLVPPITKILALQDNSEDQIYVMKDFVQTLQLSGYFSHAVQFASLAGIPMDEVYISEFQIKSESEGQNFSFWKESLSFLEKQLKEKEKLLSFLVDSVDISFSEMTIKCLLLVETIGLMCACKSEEVNCLSEVESQVFNAIIEMEASTCDKKEVKYVWERITINLRQLRDQLTEMPLPKKFEKQSDNHELLDHIVLQLVAVDPSIAVRFASGCSHRCKDTDILKLCHTLAVHKTLNEDDAILCGSHVGKTITPNFIIDNTEIISIMDALNYISRSCSRIVLMFKISLVLDKPFNDVNIESDPLFILKLLISGDYNSISLAKEFVSINNIPDKVIANLIFNEMHASFNKEIKDNSSVESSTSGLGNESFLSLLRLLNDPSVLGKHILVHLKGGRMDDQPLTTAVELYVRAHDCFSMSSDIEGISLVLRNTKLLVIQQLAPANDYYSMIRLLTGIGRYSEMTYIFDILKEHHKFELLLGKRIEKVPQLRIALLDSLKGDKELISLVALNFSMHREIAEMLESDANKTIRNIVTKRSLDIVNIKDLLERSLADLVDASDSFAKANCYNQSRRCSLWADLVALQIYLLTKEINILSLTNSQVAEFITDHPNCAESWIVAEAHGYRNWSNALYNNVVRKGDWNYYREFCSLAGIPSASLFDDIITKWQSNRATSSNSSSEETNLVKLLNSSRDVEFSRRFRTQFASSRNKSPDNEDSSFLADIMQVGNPR